MVKTHGPNHHPVHDPHGGVAVDDSSSQSKINHFSENQEHIVLSSDLNPHKKPIIDLNTDEKEVPSLFEIKPGVEKYLNKHERPRWNAYTETGGNIEHISHSTNIDHGGHGAYGAHRPTPTHTVHGWRINDHNSDPFRSNEYDDDFQPSYGRPEIKPPGFNKFRQTDEFIVSEYGRNNLYELPLPKRPVSSTSVDLEYDAYPTNFYNRRPFLARQSKDNKIDETVKKYTVLSTKPQAVYVKSPPQITNNCLGKNCRVRAKADYNSYFRPMIKRVTTSDSSDDSQKAASSRVVKALVPPSPSYFPVYANANKNYIRV